MTKRRKSSPRPDIFKRELDVLLQLLNSRLIQSHRPAPPTYTAYETTLQGSSTINDPFATTFGYWIPGPGAEERP